MTTAVILPAPRLSRPPVTTTWIVTACTWDEEAKGLRCYCRHASEPRSKCVTLDRLQYGAPPELDFRIAVGLDPAAQEELAYLR